MGIEGSIGRWRAGVESVEVGRIGRVLRDTEPVRAQPIVQASSSGSTWVIAPGHIVATAAADDVVWPIRMGVVPSDQDLSRHPGMILAPPPQAAVVCRIGRNGQVPDRAIVGVKPPEPADLGALLIVRVADPGCLQVVFQPATEVGAVEQRSPVGGELTCTRRDWVCSSPFTMAVTTICPDASGVNRQGLVVPQTYRAVPESGSQC